MDSRRNQNLRTGDILMEFGYINEEQLAQAVAYKQEHKEARIGGALIALGYITEKQMLTALGKRLDYPLVNVEDVSIDPKAVAAIPKVLAEKYCMLGYQIQNGVLGLLVNDPMNFYGIEDIRQVTGLEPAISLCEEKPLVSAIRYYYSEISAKRAADQASKKNVMPEQVTLNVEDRDTDAPIINLLNSLVIRAYNSNASDIHIEPFEHATSVRMRLDGVIWDFMMLPKNVHNSLIARIKILGDLDIAERRIPQDGHFKANVEGHDLNVRVSVIPTVFGEKAVLRLLSNNGQIDRAGNFGMSKDDGELMRRMLNAPNGIVYLTGPTGSGKSTTLYMVLEELARRNVNISTIEDPVEKNVPKVNQMQVNVQAGLTFESGLRALLRQDPDIIMVGETRDAETAAISVRAAVTGHLVLSTLHTNDAASSVSRLEDMGVEPYMLAGALVGVVAQRLVRKVCQHCGKWGSMEPDEEALAGRRIERVMHASGCGHCDRTGYKGRIAVHEILLIDPHIRKMIAEGATVDEIKSYAVSHNGMKTLKESALELVEKGITTVSEIGKIAFDLL